MIKEYQKYLNNNEAEKCQAIEDELERQLIDATNLKNRHTKCMPNSCFKDHLLKCKFNFPRFICEFLSFCLTYMEDKLYNIDINAMRNDQYLNSFFKFALLTLNSNNDIQLAFDPIRLRE